MSFPVQAQTISICDRTQQVVDAILKNSQITADSCAGVLESEMAAISDLDLNIDENNQIITSLQPGDFDGLTGVLFIRFSRNNLTRLQTRTFLGMPNLQFLELQRNSLSDLPSDIFSSLPNLFRLRLDRNQLDALPAGIFSGLANLNQLSLEENPGADFRLTVRFEPETLEEDFTTTSVRLVLREGAPRTITVPLSAVGGTLLVNSLTLATGSTQSAAFTVTRPAEARYFRLGQGRLELGGTDSAYTGFDIVRGPPIKFGGVPVRARVFLEGALE